MAPRSKPSTKTPAVKLTQLVLCDDIRQEVSGKAILIGVYADGVIVPELPATMHLSLWAVFELLQKDKSVPLKVKVCGPEDDQKQIVLKTLMEIEKLPEMPNTAVMGISKIPLQITQEGKVSIMLQQGGDDAEWETVRVFPVKLGSALEEIKSPS